MSAVGETMGIPAATYIPGAA